MSFLTEGTLRVYASETTPSTLRKSARGLQPGSVATIFLSHSHLDRELALGLIKFLGSQGITLYVDWNDTEMPQITSRGTADLVKQRIKENAVFMLLATRNALASKWVPWEVGVADQSKSADQIVVIPVADPSGYFQGSEYLQLYNRLESAEGGGFGIFEPNRNSGRLFERYLRDRG